jgi:hypothetical protein|tara:strand:- start:686 stop:886 length:201 start_codon:yes stop_codon:yes gene_type:complete
MIAKYKVKFEVRQIYNVEVEIDDPPKSSEELSDIIYDFIIEDYQVGNMKSDDPDETFSIEQVERIQ